MIENLSLSLYFSLSTFVNTGLWLITKIWTGNTIMDRRTDRQTVQRLYTSIFLREHHNTLFKFNCIFGLLSLCYKNLCFRNHEFDIRAPHKGKKRTISNLGGIPKGVQSIREHFKVNESKILPSLRLGISSTDLNEL